MTNIVTITRFYSGFCNVADTFRVGNFERDGRARTADYVLPNGYEIDGLVLRDPDGYQVEIIPSSRCGRPQLISLAGKIRTRPVLVNHNDHH